MTCGAAGRNLGVRGRDRRIRRSCLWPQYCTPATSPTQPGRYYRPTRSSIPVPVQTEVRTVLASGTNAEIGRSLGSY
eukprot:1966383-Rhodomonas_salina.1